MRERPELLNDIVIVPLFPGEMKVLNVTFRSAHIPPEDINMWLCQRYQVLLSTQQKENGKGYESSGYRAIIQLQRDPATGS